MTSPFKKFNHFSYVEYVEARDTCVNATVSALHSHAHARLSSFSPILQVQEEHKLHPRVEHLSTLFVFPSFSFIVFFFSRTWIASFYPMSLLPRTPALCARFVRGPRSTSSNQHGNLSPQTLTFCRHLTACRWRHGKIEKKINGFTVRTILCLQMTLLSCLRSVIVLRLYSAPCPPVTPPLFLIKATTTAAAYHRDTIMIQSNLACVHNSRVCVCVHLHRSDA